MSSKRSLSDNIIDEISSIPSADCVWGSVTKVLGLMVELSGLGSHIYVGTRIVLKPENKKEVSCEVVGFSGKNVIAMPFGELSGIGPNCKAYVCQSDAHIHPSDAWLGRIINGLAKPIDDKGILPRGKTPTPIRNTPPSSTSRARLGEQLNLGVRAVNTFTAMRKGQRLGIFSGSGVGKSILLSMMARYTSADIAVIGLIGERGREVSEFIEDDLGEEGLKKAIVIVATGDEPALMRRQAAYTTLAVAEYFRNQGKQVLCLMDSLTRFAMAQREIGLSAGEPPTAKGYPPTTFGELAKLIERAGTGTKKQGGMITAIFSVLVEGDDHNEVISDAVRGMLDGHIVMERKIADRGRYPAINVLASISRSMPGVLNEQQQKIIKRAKQIVTTYEDMAELIRLGAYKKGSDPDVDEAIILYPELDEFLSQNKGEESDIDESFEQLSLIVGENLENKS